MNEPLRSEITEEVNAIPRARSTRVLRCLEIPTSSWYRQAIPPGERRRPGPEPKPIPQEVEEAVVTMATNNPWYGYQRIAVMCRRQDKRVTDR